MSYQFKVNDYVLGDSLIGLSQMADRSVDLLFTDPDPERIPLNHLARVVKDTGYLILCRPDIVMPDGTVFPVHASDRFQLLEEGYRLVDYKTISYYGWVRNQGDETLFIQRLEHFMVFSREAKAPKTLVGWLNQQNHILHGSCADLSNFTWQIPFCCDVIQTYTKPGDLVVDPFAGLGPVLFSARHFERNYWGAENNPRRYNTNLEYYPTPNEA